MIRKSETLFRCDKCSKEIRHSFVPHENEDFFEMVKANQCWSIRLGQAGYGSKLDGSELNFELCDDCLYDLIKSFNHADDIIYSGSNARLKHLEKELNELDKEGGD